MKIGNTDIKTFFVGSKEADRIYLGNTLIWEKEHDDFIYDEVIPMPVSGELDFIYTSDIHVGWKDFGSARWGTDFKVFSLDRDQVNNVALVGGDVKAYQNKLINAGIPTYLLDCGDWSKSNGETDSDRNHAISVMQQMNYFGITSGNWEFKWSPISTAFSYLNKMKNYGMMSCNICNSDHDVLYPGSKNPAIPGCKTIKVGNKKIAIIAVSYPSPNGFDTYGTTEVEYNSIAQRWNYKPDGGSTQYRFRDSVNDSSQQQGRSVPWARPGGLYATVQDYVNYFKNEHDFDYVIAFGHMDKFTDENYSADSRFYSRADLILMNTIGLDAFIPGHLNSPVAETYTYKDRNNSGTGIVAPTCGGTMNSFGRMKINLKDNTISCKLLQSINDLKSI